MGHTKFVSCNQDCLENLFCIIRAKGAQRDNPDSAQFRAAFRQVMVDMVMVPSKQANCEADVDEFLCSLEQMRKSAPTQLPPPTPSVMDALPFSVRSIYLSAALSITLSRRSWENKKTTSWPISLATFTGQKHTFPPPWESIGYVLV